MTDRQFNFSREVHNFGPMNTYGATRGDWPGITIDDRQLPFIELDREIEGVTSEVYYNGPEDLTLIAHLDGAVLNTIDRAADGATGQIRLGTLAQAHYAFPTGQIRNVNGTLATGLGATAVVSLGLGTSDAGEEAPIATTSVNIVSVGALTAVASVISGNAALKAAAFNTVVNLSAAAEAARGIYLNASIPSAGSSDDSSITFNSATLIARIIRTGV